MYLTVKFASHVDDHYLSHLQRYMVEVRVILKGSYVYHTDSG